MWRTCCPALLARRCVGNTTQVIATCSTETIDESSKKGRAPIKSRKRSGPRIEDTLNIARLKPSYRRQYGVREPKDVAPQDVYVDAEKDPLNNTMPGEVLTPVVESGYAARLHDYASTRDRLQKTVRSVRDKIRDASPYERPWTKLEGYLWRAKHPDRCEPRGAYDTCIDRLPYDAAAFYRFLTRTVVRPYKAAEDQLAPRLDEDPAKLMTAMYQVVASEMCRYEDAINAMPPNSAPSAMAELKRRQTARIVRRLLDAIWHMYGGNHSLGDAMIDFDRPLDAYWLRAGFNFLYKNKERRTQDGGYLNERLPMQRHPGDHYNCVGELAFRLSAKPLAIIRTQRPFLLENLMKTGGQEKSWLRELYEATYRQSRDVSGPRVGDTEKYGSIGEEIPQSYDLITDTQPLDMRCGYTADAKTFPRCRHPFVQTIIADCTENLEQLKRWQVGEEEDERELKVEMLATQAMMLAFGSCLVQAHAMGFTRFDDLPYPFVAQSIVTNGNYWLFGTYCLRTMRHLAYDYDEWRVIDKIVNFEQVPIENLREFIEYEKPGVMSPVNEFAHTDIMTAYNWSDAHKPHISRSAESSDVADMLLRHCLRPTVSEEECTRVRKRIRGELAKHIGDKHPEDWMRPYVDTPNEITAARIPGKDPVEEFEIVFDRMRTYKTEPKLKVK